MYHNPVMLNECLEALNISADGVYVDLTHGGGGHARAILSRLGAEGRLIAFDQDEDAVATQEEDPRFLLIHQNFKYLKHFIRFLEVGKVDGILADLGISSHQIDDAGRGFSIRFDAALDMRMDKRTGVSAATLINEMEEVQLLKIFREYGEITQASKLTRAIIKARQDSPIDTTQQLMDIATPIAPRGKENRFMAQLFQALRIEVNGELEVLKEMLAQTTGVLKPAGRLVVMSYHSLEDRLVKRFMKSGNVEGHIEKDFYGNVSSPFKIINRKVITPSEEELRENSRARSAKLRIAEKI